MADKSWRDFYGNEAHRYERARYGSRYGSAFRAAHRSLVEIMLKEVVGHVSRSLDVATGTGQLVPCVASVSDSLIAIDLTPEMMRVSEKENVLPNVKYMQADAFKLPFPDSSFDLVVSSRFLHLFPELAQEKLLLEMARVCRPGGTVIVDIYNSIPRRILAPVISAYRWLANKRSEQDYYSTPEKTEAMLGAMGLQCVRSIGVGSYALAPFLWLPVTARAALMKNPMFANRLLGEQWILAGRRH